MDKRRIGAIILLVLFVALIINMLFIGYRPFESVIVYIFAVLVFLFGKKKIIEVNVTEEEKSDNNEYEEKNEERKNDI